MVHLFSSYVRGNALLTTFLSILRSRCDIDMVYDMVYADTGYTALAQSVRYDMGLYIDGVQSVERLVNGRRAVVYGCLLAVSITETARCPPLGVYLFRRCRA